MQRKHAGMMGTLPCPYWPGRGAPRADRPRLGLFPPAPPTMPVTWGRSAPRSTEGPGLTAVPAKLEL